MKTVNLFSTTMEDYFIVLFTNYIAFSNGMYTDSQKHEYVCTERLFDNRPFMYNKIFLKKFEIDVIFHRKQRFYRFQTFFKDSLCLKWLTNLGEKGAKQREKMWATNFLKSFSKIFCWPWTVNCQKFVHFIRMLCPGCFILNGIVS